MPTGVYIRTNEMNMNQSARMKGKVSPMFGRHHSPEEKANLSAKLKGRISPMKGKHQTEEFKRKISENAQNNPNYGMKNKHHSDVTKQLLSEKGKGRIPWNKGRTGVYSPETIENMRKTRKGMFAGEKSWNFGKHPSLETRLKISKFNKGKVTWMKGKHHSPEALMKMRGRVSSLRGKCLSEEHKKNISKSKMGHLVSEATREKLREFMRGRRVGEKNSAWKGGVTPIRKKARRMIEGRKWRKAVLERDNFTCQKCGGHNLLRVHHILNFSEFPELRWNVSNGVVFCKECHQDFHKKYGIKHNTKEQVEEFLGHPLVLGNRLESFVVVGV